jgi:hypothetical protein
VSHILLCIFCVEDEIYNIPEEVFLSNLMVMGEYTEITELQVVPK